MAISALVCAGRTFLVPAAVAPATGMHLRLVTSSNGQAAGLHWAADYELGPAPADAQP
jgi:hypothetical protein